MVSGARRAPALPSRRIAIALASHAAHVADFTCVCSLPADEIGTKTRVANLTSSWRERLPARCAECMSRVGFAARRSTLRASVYAAWTAQQIVNAIGAESVPLHHRYSRAA